MNQGNQLSRALGVAILLGIVTIVIAFGQRDPTTDSKQDNSTANKVVLRHPYALSVDAPVSHVKRASNWSAHHASERGQRAPTAPQAPLEMLTALPNEANPRSPKPPRFHGVTNRHRIVEGDSLEQLAAKYLGSRDRFMELFNANRAVLSHPDILPLGEHLVIPAERPFTRPMATQPSYSATPLVPLP